MAQNAYLNFQISPPKPNHGKGNRGSNRDNESARPQYLILGTFTSAPKLHFERLPIGRSRSRVLVVRNPTPNEIWFQFIKLPKPVFEMSYEGCENEMVILPALGQLTVTIKWTPTEVGHVCEPIRCKSQLSGVTLTIQLLGEAEPSLTVTKGKSGLSSGRRFAPLNTNLYSPAVAPHAKSVCFMNLENTTMNIDKLYQAPMAKSTSNLSCAAPPASRRETYLVPPTPKRNTGLMSLTTALSCMSLDLDDDDPKENFPPLSISSVSLSLHEQFDQQAEGLQFLSNDNVDHGHDDAGSKDSSFNSASTSIITTSNLPFPETRSSSPTRIRASDYFKNKGIFGNDEDLEGELIAKAFQQLELMMEFNHEVFK